MTSVNVKLPGAPAIWRRRRQQRRNGVRKIRHAMMRVIFKRHFAQNTRGETMATAIAEITKEEVARRGKEIYERDIRHLVESGNRG
jgi:hypothetical protein